MWKKGTKRVGRVEAKKGADERDVGTSQCLPLLLSAVPEVFFMTNNNEESLINKNK